MNFAYQLNSEEITLRTTEVMIPVWFSNYPLCLDALFEVAYFLGKADDATSPEGHFYTLGYQTLVQLPYTVRATCVLIERGFYFEAVLLVRNLYESFFQLRYFHNHKSSILAHWTKKPRIRIKTMFEEIAPNFYDWIYGAELSEFAHSGVGSSVFRTKYSSPEVSETIMGSKYDEAGCSYSINKIITIVYGVLNYIPILFPQYLDLVEETTENKRKEALAWLDFVMREHLASKPEAKEFYDLVNPLLIHT
jgi:hypothetical protein